MAEAEAELRRETERLFQDIGLSDVPPDSLDFFQKNLENGSSSDEWKRALKPPTNYNKARRTSSDGTTLVHLKKKYSTGLNPDYHSKRTSAIAAVTAQSQKPEASSSSSSGKGNTSPTKLRSRRLSPAGLLGSRFGFTGSTKVGSSADSSSKKPPLAAEKSTTASKEADQPSMLKRRAQQRSSVHSPPSSEGRSSSPVKRLVHTSSAGSIRQPAPVAPPPNSGSATLSKVESSNCESGASRRPHGSSKRAECSANALNGVHPPVASSMTAAPSAGGAVQPASRTAASNLHSHSSTETTAPNTTTTSTSSRNNTHPAGTTATTATTTFIHNSIDISKHSNINMRSLTKSTERKTSTERKLSDGKPSFIPTPSTSSSRASAAGSNKGSVPSTESITTSGSMSNTQVLYNRKSSFKVVNVSSSSHRIMHTVQDGGAPKRHNSINRGSVNRGSVNRTSRPISLVATQQQQVLANKPLPTSSSRGQEGHTSPTASSGGQENLTSQPPMLERQGQPQQQGGKVEGSVVAGSGESSGYDSLATHLVNGETTGAKSASQNQQSGLYDRLSPPVDKPARKEPVYETIKENLPSLPASKNESLRKLASPPLKENGDAEVESQGLSRQNIPAVARMLKAAGTDGDRHSPDVTRSLNLRPSRHSNGPPASDSSSFASDSHRLEHAPTSRRAPSSGHVSSAARRESKDRFEDQQQQQASSAVGKLTSPIRRYPVESGAVYTAVTKTTGANQRKSSHPLFLIDSGRGREDRARWDKGEGEGEVMVRHERSSSYHAATDEPGKESKQTPVAETFSLKPHRPVRPSLSDHAAMDDPGRASNQTPVSETFSLKPHRPVRPSLSDHAAMGDPGRASNQTPVSETFSLKPHRPVRPSLSDHAAMDDPGRASNQTPVSETFSLKPHRPVRPSLSDTTSPPSAWLPSKVPEASSESSLQSTASTEPLSDSSKRQDSGLNVENLDTAERKAKLEVNWSMQSLNENMKEVASTTVAALSTLMEVLTTPSTATADKKFSFDRYESVF